MAAALNGHKLGALLLLTIALVLLAQTPARAQSRDYQPGQQIEYRSSGYPEVWEVATFLRATPEGSQPIIRQAPTEFDKEGFQRATSWAEIRAIASAPERSTVDAASDASAATHAERVDHDATALMGDAGVGLMTRAEVIGFLQARLGDTPFQNPRRDEIKQELVAQIKARGLDFRPRDADPDFDRKLSKFGATSDIVFPLRDNYGAPTRQEALMGGWSLGKIGATVDYVRGDHVYRQGEIGVSNIGTLRLDANGSFDWQTVTAESTRGTWRAATAQEMNSQGGAGLVLLDAKGGYEWIVMKDRATTLAGEWISVAQLNSRQIREFGSRGTKKN